MLLHLVISFAPSVLSRLRPSTLAALTLFGAVQVGLCSQSGPEQPAPTVSQINQSSSLSSITTLDGKIFNAVTVQRVEPDGLEVSYVPEGGGLGLAKLKFRNLPEDLRRQYGYNVSASDQFESSLAQSQAAWMAEHVQWEQQKQQAEAQQRQQDEQLRQAAQAEQYLSFPPYGIEGNYYNSYMPIAWSSGWWYDTGPYRRLALRRHHAPHGQVVQPVSKTIGPMQPNIPPMQPYIAPMQPRGGSPAPAAHFGGSRGAGHVAR